jgi:GDP-4-dehydro-6-deoxy-D-mannose reductase
VRVLVTGATGFVGRWLLPELEAAGHEAVAGPSSKELDLGSSPDFVGVIRETRPDAVAHLAAISFVPAVEADPEHARRVNVEGTKALLAGLDAVRSDAPVLVTSSAEVYGVPDRLPVSETAAVRPVNAYGLTKVDQERVAIEARTRGRRLAITRAFNHVGPGQRPSFVVPKMARSVLQLRSGAIESIPLGNIDRRRDFTDVRDVVVAYRLVLEALADHRDLRDPPIYNVGSGRSISIREVLEAMCALTGVAPRWHVDPDLLRTDDVQDNRADASALRAATGWAPRIPFEQSLRDVLASTTG